MARNIGGTMERRSARLIEEELERKRQQGEQRRRGIAQQVGTEPMLSTPERSITGKRLPTADEPITPKLPTDDLPRNTFTNKTERTPTVEMPDMPASKPTPPYSSLQPITTDSLQEDFKFKTEPRRRYGNAEETYSASEIQEMQGWDRNIGTSTKGQLDRFGEPIAPKPLSSERLPDWLPGSDQRMMDFGSYDEFKSKLSEMGFGETIANVNADPFYKYLYTLGKSAEMLFGGFIDSVTMTAGKVEQTGQNIVATSGRIMRGVAKGAMYVNDIFSKSEDTAEWLTNYINAYDELIAKLEDPTWGVITPHAASRTARVNEFKEGTSGWGKLALEGLHTAYDVSYLLLEMMATKKFFTKMPIGLSSQQGQLAKYGMKYGMQAPQVSKIANTLLGFLNPRTASGIKGVVATPAPEHVQMMHGAMVTAGHGLLTEQGDLRERVEATAYRIAYTHTPYVAKATGLSGLGIIGADFIINSFLTMPQYIQVAKDLGDGDIIAGMTDPDYWIFASTQIALDLYFSKSTKGLKGAEYERALRTQAAKEGLTVEQAREKYNVIDQAVTRAIVDPNLMDDRTRMLYDFEKFKEAADNVRYNEKRYQDLLQHATGVARDGLERELGLPQGRTDQGDAIRFAGGERGDDRVSYYVRTGERFGIGVIPVELDPHYRKIDAIFIPGDPSSRLPNSIMVNINGDRRPGQPAKILGHELFHDMRALGIAGRYDSQLMSIVSGLARSDKVREERIADLAGEMFTTKKFWESMKGYMDESERQMMMEESARYPIDDTLNMLRPAERAEAEKIITDMMREYYTVGQARDVFNLVLSQQYDKMQYNMSPEERLILTDIAANFHEQAGQFYHRADRAVDNMQISTYKGRGGGDVTGMRIRQAIQYFDSDKEKNGVSPLRKGEKEELGIIEWLKEIEQRDPNYIISQDEIREYIGNNKLMVMEEYWGALSDKGVKEIDQDSIAPNGVYEKLYYNLINNTARLLPTSDPIVLSQREGNDLFPLTYKVNVTGMQEKIEDAYVDNFMNRPSQDVFNRMSEQDKKALRKYFPGNHSLDNIFMMSMGNEMWETGIRKMFDVYRVNYNTLNIDQYIKDGHFDDVGLWRVLEIPTDGVGDVRESRMGSSVFKNYHENTLDLNDGIIRLYVPHKPENDAQAEVKKDINKVVDEYFNVLDVLVRNTPGKELLDKQERRYVVKDGKYIPIDMYYMSQKDLALLINNLVPKEYQGSPEIETLIRGVRVGVTSMNKQIRSPNDRNQLGYAMMGESTKVVMGSDGNLEVKHTLGDFRNIVSKKLMNAITHARAHDSTVQIESRFGRMTGREALALHLDVIKNLDQQIKSHFGIDISKISEHPVYSKQSGWELYNTLFKIERIVDHGRVILGTNVSLKRIEAQIDNYTHSIGRGVSDQWGSFERGAPILKPEEKEKLESLISNKSIDELMGIDYEKIYTSGLRETFEMERMDQYDLPLNNITKRTADQLKADVKEDISNYYNTYRDDMLTENLLYHQLLQRKPNWFGELTREYREVTEGIQFNVGNPRWLEQQGLWEHTMGVTAGITRPPLTRQHQEMLTGINAESIPLNTTGWRESGAEPKSYGVMVIKLPTHSNYRQGMPKHGLPDNTMVHVRYQIYKTFQDGVEKKILFIEEIQSDWAIALRRQGNYRSVGQDEEIAKRYIEIMDKLGYSPQDRNVGEALNVIMGSASRDLPYIAGQMRNGEEQTWRLSPASGDRSESSLSDITTFPFKNESHMLGIKRIVSLAAEKGFDGVAFSSGLQQSMRWNTAQWYDGMKMHINNLDKLSDTERTELAGAMERISAPIVGHKDAKTIYNIIANKEYQLREVVDNITGEVKPNSFDGDATRRYSIDIFNGPNVVTDTYVTKLYDQIIIKDTGKYLKREFGSELTRMQLENMDYGKLVDGDGKQVQFDSPGFWINEKMHQHPALFHRTGNADRDPFIFYKNANNEYVTGNGRFKIIEAHDGKSWKFIETGKGAIGTFESLAQAREEAGKHFKVNVPEARDLEGREELLRLAPSLEKMADELVAQNTKTIYSSALDELRLRIKLAEYAISKGTNITKHQREVRIATKEIQDLYSWRENLEEAREIAEQEKLPPQLRNQELFGKTVEIESGRSDSPTSKVEQVQKAFEQNQSIKELVSVWNDKDLTNKMKMEMSAPILEDIGKAGARALVDQIKNETKFPYNHIREEVKKLYPDVGEDRVKVAKDQRAYQSAYNDFKRDVDMMKTEIERLQEESAKNNRSGNREYFRGESYWKVGKKLSGGIISLVNKLNRRIDRFASEWGHKYSEYEIDELRKNLSMVSLKAEEIKTSADKAMVDSGAYHQMSWHELRSLATTRGVSAKAGATRTQIEMELERLDAKEQGKTLWDVLKSEARDRGIAIGGKTLNDLWSTLRKSRVDGDKPTNTVTTVTPDGIKHEEVKSDEAVVIRAGETAATGTRLPIKKMTRTQVIKEGLSWYGVDLTSIKDLPALKKRLRELRDAYKEAKNKGLSPDIPVIEIEKESILEDPKTMGNKRIINELVEVFGYDREKVSGWVRSGLIKNLNKERAKIADAERPIPVEHIEEVILKSPEPLRPTATRARMMIKEMSADQVRAEAEQRYGVIFDKKLKIDVIKKELYKLRRNEQKIRNDGGTPIIPSDQIVEADPVKHAQEQRAIGREAQNREIVERFRSEVKNQEIYTNENLERRIATFTGKNIPYAEDVIKIARDELERRRGLPRNIPLDELKSRLDIALNRDGISGVRVMFDKLMSNKAKYPNWRDAADVIARMLDDLYSERFDAKVGELAILRKKFLDKNIPIGKIEEYLRNDYRLVNKLREAIKKLQPLIYPSAEELRREKSTISLLEKTDTPKEEPVLRYAHLSDKDNRAIGKLDKYIAKIADAKKQKAGVQLQEYLDSNDKEKVIYDYLYKLSELSKQEGFTEVPAMFLESLKLQLDNRTGDLSFNDLFNIRQAELLYLKEKSEEGSIVMRGRNASLPQVRETILAGARNTHGKAELDEVLSDSHHKRSKWKHYLLLGQIGLHRTALNLEGAVWNTKNILRDETMPKLYQLTMGAVQDAYKVKFKFLYDETVPFTDLISAHMERGEDVLRDSYTMSPKAKDINWRHIKLEGGQLRDDGTINGSRKAIELSPGEIMMLYILCRNPEVRAEILNGGLRVPAHKTGFSRRFKQHEANVYKLTENDLNKIVGNASQNIPPMLTNGQKERADFMFKRFNGAFRDFVNEWSYRGMGILAATQDIYGPLSRSPYDVKLAIVNQPVGKGKGKWGNELPNVTTSNFGVKTMEMMSLLQQRNYSGKPVKVEDAYRAFIRYINQASDLPFMEVYRNYDKLFADSKFKSQLDQFGGKLITNKDLRESLNSQMTRIATFQAKQISDIEHATTDLFVRFQQAKLGLNPWVIPIQGISLLYGFTEIPMRFAPKSFADLLAVPFRYEDNKEIFDEIKEFSPTNGMHRFMAGAMSQSVGEIYDYGKLRATLLGDKMSLKDKIMSGRWVTGGIRQVDSVVMLEMWKGIKNWVDQERSDLTDRKDKLQLVAKIYDHIVDTSQPSHLPHTRGEVTTNRDIVVRSLTMFMSQRNKIFNELIHVPIDYMRSEQEPEDLQRAIWKLAVYGMAGPALLTLRDEARDWWKMRPRTWATRMYKAFQSFISVWALGGNVTSSIMNKVKFGEFSQRGSLDSNIVLGFVDGAINVGTLIYRAITTESKLVEPEEKKSNIVRVGGTPKPQGVEMDHTARYNMLKRAVAASTEVFDVLLGFPVTNLYRETLDAGRRISPELQFAIDHIGKNPDPTTLYKRYWEFWEAGDTKMMERQLYMLMSPSTLGREIDNLEGSFQTYFKRGDLPQQAWDDTKKLYDKMAIENGWQSSGNSNIIRVRPQ